MYGQSAYPNLPGFTPGHDPTVSFTQKVSNRRVSAAQQEANRDYANVAIPQYQLPRRNRQDAPDQSRMLNPQYMSTTHSVHAPMQSNEITDQFEPTFVKLDRQVLRYTGYFREAVVESRLEHYSIRRLTLFYYIEDHTLSINEHRQVNSGRPQGAFLKRRQVLKDDQSGICIQPRDLIVGENIVILGKNIRIVSCDQYTREFCELNNIPQGPDEEIPIDPFVEETTRPRMQTKDAMMKDFLEKSLGGGRPKPEKQFLDNDRRVLRFFCTSGEPFIMHYYLADDTVEILEVHAPNDGRRDFPVYLKRAKLQKDPQLGQPGIVPEGEYLREFEIFPHMSINIYGRQFELNSADTFTVFYYDKNYNRAFPLGPIANPGQLDANNIVIPPHDGIGSEEDSLGYVYRLIPNPPKKDYFKFIDNSSKILRWVLKFNTTAPEDTERRFVLAYFLNDDTLQIHEIPQRNSGVVEGKFLIRNRYKNIQNNEQYFRPHDFLTGKDVTINRYRFHIESCDEYTRKYMEEHFNIS